HPGVADPDRACGGRVGDGARSVVGLDRRTALSAGPRVRPVLRHVRTVVYQPSVQGNLKNRAGPPPSARLSPPDVRPERPGPGATTPPAPRASAGRVRPAASAHGAPLHHR